MLLQCAAIATATASTVGVPAAYLFKVCQYFGAAQTRLHSAAIALCRALPDHMVAEVRRAVRTVGRPDVPEFAPVMTQTIVVGVATVRTRTMFCPRAVVRSERQRYVQPCATSVATIVCRNRCRRYT